MFVGCFARQGLLLTLLMALKKVIVTTCGKSPTETLVKDITLTMDS